MGCGGTRAAILGLGLVDVGERTGQTRHIPVFRTSSSFHCILHNPSQHSTKVSRHAPHRASHPPSSPNKVQHLASTCTFDKHLVASLGTGNRRSHTDVELNVATVAQNKRNKSANQSTVSSVHKEAPGEIHGVPHTPLLETDLSSSDLLL